MTVDPLNYRFTPPKPRSQQIMDAMLLDEELERSIDEAGRYKVFGEAKRLGWEGKTPPQWVWRAIINSLSGPKATT